MSSSGWLRVAMGVRKVAQAAAVHVAENGQEIASKAVMHSGELGMTARTAAMAAMSQQQQQQFWNVGNTHYDTTAIHPSNPPPKPQTDVSSPLPPSLPDSEELPPGTESSSSSSSPPSTTSLSILESSEALSTSMPPSQQEPESSLPTESLSQPDNSIRVSEDARDEKVISDDDLQPQVSRAVEENMESPPSDAEETYNRLAEGKRVPSSRFSRAFGFASLGMGLVMGTASEAASRFFKGSSSTGKGSVVVNDANADRLAATLCRMRGAALKMGQMLSIQDESLLPPALTRALNQVRQGADAMPKSQLERQLVTQLGDDWREKFESFDDSPFAAASIGQVHRARVKGKEENVVVKVQYPGVANSIESDLRNLTMLVKMSGFAPKGLFIDNVIRVGRDELKVECDYLQEMENQKRFKQLVENDPILSKERFVVPDVISELTTAEVLTTEYARGGTIDKVINLDQDERDRIGRHIFYLTIQELFVWRFMQTDPNWGNFLYDVGTRTTSLIDFGAAREYSHDFVDGYLRIVWANANRDEETLMDISHKMGFLTGEENSIMLEAHKQSGFTLGEPFATDEPFDFRGSQISSRLSAQSSAFMKHRLTPPPEEVYTLHRKLAGAFMLCIKLGAKVKCRDLLENVIRNHTFKDGMPPPKLD